MNRGWLLAAVAGHVFALAGTPGLAQSPAPAKPDMAKAQQIVTTVCAACHGAEGVSVAPVNPNLAGQHPEYIARQLEHFKNGLRKNPVMTAMSATVQDQDIKAISLYFADKKPKLGSAKDKDLAELGQKIYRGGNSKTGLPACSSCHAPTGAGMPAQYPRISGQAPEYTYAQLVAFNKGERGGEIKDAAGKVIEDTQGKVMAQVAAKMNDREMKAVAEFVSGLH